MAQSHRMSQSQNLNLTWALISDCLPHLIEQNIYWVIRIFPKHVQPS